ncbi:MAG TPA: type II CAAX endopeptidase family protein [Candidatus Angelobacter sp.]
MWHTALMIALIAVTSYGGSVKLPGEGTRYGRFLLYSETAVMEFIFVLIIWFGIKRQGVTMRELIGGRWSTPEDFLIDLGIGIGFWLASAIVIAPLKIALGLIDIHNPAASLRQMKEAVAPLIPTNGLELGLFLLLTILAGLFEEIIFRGYLMKQFGALSGNIYIGVVASAIVFGGAHGYQGARQMVLIAAFGILIGLLAVWRKSLRPGMIAHAWTDAISGVFLFFS